MDVRKKNFLDNLRFKRAKFPNLIKPGKKPLAKQGRNLAKRRSISVPDLRLVPGQALSSESIATPSDTDGIYFGICSRQSDSDSVASGSVTDGFTEKTMETLSLYEETDDMKHSGSGNKINLTPEPIYAQVDKKTKWNVTKFDFEPIPAPRSVFNAPGLSSRSHLVTNDSFSSEDTPVERIVPSSLAAALDRAQSLGDQTKPKLEKRAVSFDQRKTSSEKGTPPTGRHTPLVSISLAVDAPGTPLEDASCTSLDSAYGFFNEEQGNTPWMTDMRELDREPSTPNLFRDFASEEALLEQAMDGETVDEMEVCNEASDTFDENLQEPFDSSQVAASVQGPLPFQRYLLSINLKRGKSLVIRDKRAGSSDPYVKFKLEGKQFYKSKVVYKSLNPRWNESFSHPLRDRDHDVEVRVYDKNRTSDDFMGSSTISLKELDLYRTYEMELRLDDPKSKEEDMGVIIVDVCLMYRDATIKRSPRWLAKKNKQNQASPTQRSGETQMKNQLKSQMWTGVFGITLVEGQDLPQYGHGDIYVRFRLGDQKYKSKNLCIQANPQWRERFDFNQFEDNQEPLQVGVYSKSGRKCEESWGMFEIDLSILTPNERQLYTHVLDPGKGRLVFVVTLRPCWGVSVSDMETAPLEKVDEKDQILNRFSLKNSHKCVGEVGFLQVKVVKANDLPPSDLNGKSNPLCVIELGNSKLQTHTVYKSVNPEWNKAVTFPIKDIHDVIEFTVLDENGDKTPTFLGKVAIPLLSVQNGQEICMVLKKENLESVSKGTITLALEVIYNKVRAGVRTFQPKETKFTEENPKFSKKVLARHIYRVRKISTAVLYTLQYINSCFQWESTQRSLIAFLIFVVTVWHFELFMLPLFLLLIVGWNYFHLTTGKANFNQDLVNMSIGDDDEEDEKEFGKKGLMDKIHMVQEVVLVVQAVLDEVANIGERIKNIFNWSVPFLSCMACLVLFVSTMLLYFISLRYIVLIWGVNKFTKKLRNPYTIDNNEILDFLKRVPSDVQKVQYSTLRAPTSQSQPRRKR